MLFGLDSDLNLLDAAKTNGYDRLNHKKITNRLLYLRGYFDYTWSSEFLEHLPNLNIVDEIERITTYGIVITLPNPLSPHFKRDDTHILRYSVRGLKKFFKNRKGWKYKVRGLGFDDIPAPLFVKKMTSMLLWYFPMFSPTVAVIGERELPSPLDIILKTFGKH